MELVYLGLSPFHALWKEAKDKAEALEADLRPLVGGAIVTRMSKHDTNPANNPQPPARYR